MSKSDDEIITGRRRSNTFHIDEEIVKKNIDKSAEQMLQDSGYEQHLKTSREYREEFLKEENDEELNKFINQVGEDGQARRNFLDEILKQKREQESRNSLSDSDEEEKTNIFGMINKDRGGNSI